MTISEKESRLPFWTKLIYGTGDWSTASFGTLRQLFYAIFLTDVVGLEPRIASVVALIGILWDAINDPIVGTLTDRVRTRWGRRRPFLLFFAIPYGATFMLFWWAPPIENQMLLGAVVCLAFILADSLQTLVYVPFISLLPEIAPDYDQRTELTGFRMFFNLLASLTTAVAAPAIVDSILSSGGTQQQGYMLIAALFGGIAALPFLLIFTVVRERTRSAEEQKREQETPFMEAVRTAWSNIPFRFATVLYMLNWITFDLVGLCLPFFLVYWVARGNLLEKALGLPIESTVFALLLVTSLFAPPEQAQRLHGWDEFLGGRAVIDLHHPTRADQLHPGAGSAGRHLSFQRARVAGCHLSGRDRMGRVAHRTPSGGHLLRRDEFRPQNDRRLGDLRSTAGVRLVWLPVAAGGRDLLPTIRNHTRCHSFFDWAAGRGAALQRHYHGLVLSTDTRETCPYSQAAGEEEGTLYRLVSLQITEIFYKSQPCHAIIFSG
jgi:hypothetical protein